MSIFSRLPLRFPVGTHYVVEGEPGDEGELLVTSRYLVLPNGTQVNLMAGGALDRRASVARRVRRRNSRRSSSRRHH